MLADLMGCDPFVMSVCGSVAGGITLSENQWEGGEAETENLILQGWKGKGQDRKPNFVPCSARIVSRWVVVA